MNPRPLTSSELLDMAINNQPLPLDRVLATYANEDNWRRIYHGQTAPGESYRACACEWAFVGPVRPPYDLARIALQNWPNQ